MYKKHKIKSKRKVKLTFKVPFKGFNNYHIMPKQLALYVVSDPTNSGRFKIGTHKGTQEHLEKTLLKYFPDVEIHFFVYTPNAEKIVKDLFFKTDNKLQITSREGSFCGWYRMSLEQISLSILTSMTNLSVQKPLRNNCERCGPIGTIPPLDETSIQIKTVTYLNHNDCEYPGDSLPTTRTEQELDKELDEISDGIKKYNATYIKNF